jgi:very-short-patch-repair endonuclease
MPKTITNETFIEQCNKIHKNKYDYSMTVYTNARNKIDIICPIHGTFKQISADHKNGRGCRLCATVTTKGKTSLSQEEFIQKAKERYSGYDYDYSAVRYINTTTKVEIICPQHGSFLTLPGNYLYGNKIGCPRCAIDATKCIGRSNTTEFINKANEIHGETYNYDLVNYINNIHKVRIVCSNHGIFEQSPMSHLSGGGCPVCAKIRGPDNKIKNHSTTFWKQANDIHATKYIYDESSYTGIADRITATCPVHGVFKVIAANHLRGVGCQECKPTSKYEELIKRYLDSNNIEYIQHYKKLKDDIGKLEIDFFIPSKALGIEVDGLYWHSEMHGEKDRNYHVRKTELCEKNGIRLIHIFSNEFVKFEKIKNKLNILLNIGILKHHARKCTVREIDKDLCGQFLEQYHLQGKDRSKHKIGLFDECDHLIAVMTFSLPRVCLGYKNKETFMEMSRYCSLPGCVINGGASKLLSYFETHYKPNKIVTFADRRWSTPSFYKTIGFTLDHISPPNYWYFKIGRDDKLFHRFGFRKNILNTKLQTFDPTVSEWNNMKMNKYDRIWDCGNYVFTKYV